MQTTPSHFIVDEHDEVVDWADDPFAAQSILDALARSSRRPHRLLHKNDLAVAVHDAVTRLQRSVNR